MQAAACRVAGTSEETTAPRVSCSQRFRPGARCSFWDRPRSKPDILSSFVPSGALDTHKHRHSFLALLARLKRHERSICFVMGTAGTSKPPTLESLPRSNPSGQPSEMHRARRQSGALARRLHRLDRPPAAPSGPLSNGRR